jgi:hypothetical protein
MTTETTALGVDWLTSHVFSFEAGPQRHVLSSTFVFEPDGTINGYYHPNESRWRFEDGALLILRSDGVVSCKAQPVAGPNGELELAGGFLLTGNGGMHHFRPIATRASQSIVQSFDLFDTLVARYCFRPTAIFEAVEAKARAEGFARLRQQLESQLWSRGDYTFDDIYVSLAAATGWPEARIEQLKMLELAEEWENLFPIREMTARVRPDDIIVTDMYLPVPFIESVVHDKCGLHGVDIHLSNHGKHHGTIWPYLQSRHRIVRHHGDNKVADVAQARKAGIEAAHVTFHEWTFGERTLNAIGLEAFARAIRKARLTTFAFDKVLRQLQLAQFDVNIPVLVIASLLLLRHAKAAQADTLLMCGRDCNLWIHLLKWMVSLSAHKPQAHYFLSSRELFLKESPDYAAYFAHLRGNRTLITDLSGTGRTPAHFIGRIGAQADTGVYITLKSDDVAPEMAQLAPVRPDVASDFAIMDGGTRFVFERLNSALEGRATGMEFDGHEFKVVRDLKPLDARAEEMVTAMHDAFKAAMAELQAAPVRELPDGISEEHLRQALQALVGHSVSFVKVARFLPE